MSVSIPPALYAIPPKEMKNEWVGQATQELQDRYYAYYTSHKLEAESQGWTSWVTQKVAGHANILLKKGSDLFLPGVVSTAVHLAVDNEETKKVAGSVVQKVHGVYTAKTRVPVEHSRVNDAIDKLYEIKECANSQVLIDTLLQLYTKRYLASAGSGKLITSLESKEETLADKIDHIVSYLLRQATLKDFEDLFYNNGKRLFQVAICTIENTKISSTKPKV